MSVPSILISAGVPKKRARAIGKRSAKRRRAQVEMTPSAAFRCQKIHSFENWCSVQYMSLLKRK